MPWDTWTYFDLEGDHNRLLAECGLPPRPPGRVWLLRPPPDHATVDDFLRTVITGWEERGGLVMPDAGLVEYAATQIAAAFHP